MVFSDLKSVAVVDASLHIERLTSHIRDRDQCHNGEQKDGGTHRRKEHERGEHGVTVVCRVDTPSSELNRVISEREKKFRGRLTGRRVSKTSQLFQKIVEANIRNNVVELVTTIWGGIRCCGDDIAFTRAAHEPPQELTPRHQHSN